MYIVCLYFLNLCSLRHVIQRRNDGIANCTFLDPSTTTSVPAQDKNYFENHVAFEMLALFCKT